MTKNDESDDRVIRGKFGNTSAKLGTVGSAARQNFIEGLYRNSFADLSRTLRRVYGLGPPEPEDLAQQAFEKLSGLESLDHVENPRAFLFTVAINLGLKSIRRIQRARAYVADQLKLPGAGLEEIDPSRLYQGREKIRALEAEMARLSEKQREIVIRSRLYGHTYAEIARTTGWSEADISRQLNAALKVLMDAIEDRSAGIPTAKNTQNDQ
jgi:RNA polymerase sigma factor (sigma-70 family)